MDNHTIQEDAVTAVQAMEIIGISNHTFYRAQKEGLIPAARYWGKRPYYLRAEIAGINRADLIKPCGVPAHKSKTTNQQRKD